MDWLLITAGCGIAGLSLICAICVTGARGQVNVAATTGREIDRHTVEIKRGDSPFGWRALAPFVAITIVFVGTRLAVAHSPIVPNVIERVLSDVWLPAWMLFILVMLHVLPVHRMRRVENLVESHARLLCPDCLYSLQGLPESGKCPECGHDYELAAVRAYWDKLLEAYEAVRRRVPLRKLWGI